MHEHHLALNAVPAGHPAESRAPVYQAVAKPPGGRARPLNRWLGGIASLLRASA